jgi:Tfp pilus assembly protein PilF
LRAAIAAQPKWTQPYLDLSALRFAQNDPAGAVTQLQAGLKEAPDDIQLNASLAELYDRTGDSDKAIAVYEKMLVKNSDNAIATNNLAALLVDRKGDPASVKRAVELSAKLEKTTQPAFTDTAGWAYLKAGDTQKAVDILKRTVEKAPDVPIFQYHLGVAYQKAGDNVAAKTHLSKALELNPKFSQADDARTALAAIK